MPRQQGFDPDLVDLQSLLDAIAQQESGTDPHTIGDRDFRSPAYGAYQMREPAFRDVQRLRPHASEGVASVEMILGDLELQRRLAAAYLDILQQEYGMTGFNQIVGAYNAGVGNIRKGRYPWGYLKGVRSHLTPPP